MAVLSWMVGVQSFWNYKKMFSNLHKQQANRLQSFDDPRCRAGVKRVLKRFKWDWSGKCQLESAAETALPIQYLYWDQQLSAFLRKSHHPLFANTKRTINGFPANPVSKSMFRWWKGFPRASPSSLVRLVLLNLSLSFVNRNSLGDSRLFQTIRQVWWLARLTTLPFNEKRERRANPQKREKREKEGQILRKEKKREKERQIFRWRHCSLASSPHPPPLPGSGSSQLVFLNC